MNKFEILDFLKIGENREIEFKESKNKLPKSIWETYSAMSNTNGGYIILGVKENKPENLYTIEGVENPHNILSDFWNSINNKEKVNYMSIIFENVLKKFKH